VPEKAELIEAIALLIESDPNATPLSYELLELMETEELASIKANLERTKASRDYAPWYDELVQTCGKEEG